MTATHRKLKRHAPQFFAKADILPRVPIVLLTALGAFLRFFAVGRQGFWFDEAYTVYLVQHGPGRMLGLLPHLESTPPLYYCVAWIWSRIFGFGPAGLKSFSALCGTLTIPVAYAAARKLLANWRSAVIVGALVACNPFLVWYSQEARAYSMLVLMSACTLLAFAYALERPRALPLTLWAISCGLALTTHYYAVIVIVPEAVWLLYEHRRARAVQAGIAAVICIGLALLPLAVTQNGTRNNHWIANSSLALRLRQVLPLFLLGPQTHAREALKFLAFAMVALGIAMLIWRSRRRERQAALLPGLIALSGLVIAVGPGHSTFLGRNLLPILVPASIFLAAGFGATRARLAGICATLVLCAIGITAVISVDTTRGYQRPNWQLVANALGRWPPPGTSARDGRIVVVQDIPGILPLGLYMKGLRYIDVDTLKRIVEIDVVAALPHKGLGGFCWWGSECNLVPSRLNRRYVIPGFRIAGRMRVRDFGILKLRASGPTAVERTALPARRHRRRRRHFIQAGHSPLKDAQLIQQA